MDSSQPERSNIQASIAKLFAGENLTRTEAEAVFRDFEADPSGMFQMIAFVTALNLKGPTSDERAALDAFDATRKYLGKQTGDFTNRRPEHRELFVGGLQDLVTSGADLSRADATYAMEEILSGRVHPLQIATFLAALKFKGETVDELVGFATAMRRHATPIFSSPRPADEVIVDTCGTGGDSSGTFNVSTAAAFVVAGAGVRVAKHGNRSISSRCGSADVLEQLGVKIDLAPDRVGRAIEQVGIGFLFAPAVHASTRHAMPVRRELKFRTVFNLLGPLTNPANAKAQVVGVYERGVTELMATALGELGVKRAFVVHGAEGLDEISLVGETHVAELRDGVVRKFTVTPEDFGVARAPLEAIRGGDAKHNAEIIHKILGRSLLYREHGPHRDIVLANSAAALVAAGRAGDFLEGVRLAAHSIDSGAARERLEALVVFSQTDSPRGQSAR